MRGKLARIGAIIAVGSILAAAACASDVAAPGQTAPPATQDVQATITALAQGIPSGTPTPTPVPAAARKAALDFAAGQRTISNEWDQVHADIDTWRESLAPCTANSVGSALSGFAGRFASITQAARELPRPAIVRGLADDLIQAAEQEEAALRLLRDTWQPGLSASGPSASPSPPAPNSPNDPSSDGDGSDTPAPAPAPAFEQVDMARSSASALRKGVSDILIDRADITKPESVEQVNSFLALFEDLESAWDQFHEDYDSLRNQLADLDSAEAVAELGRLVDQFRGIVAAVHNLPDAVATQQVIQILAETAEEEDRSLRLLRGQFQSGAGSSDGTASGEENPAEEAPVQPGEEAEVADLPPESGNDAPVRAEDLALFDTFEAQLVTSNSTRRRAKQDLAKVLKDISPETQAAVTEFSDEYDRLLRGWDEFHFDYDEWRASEGGCNRAKTIETLGGFTTALGKIASDARNLPAATVLRPMGELLVGAAEREERAVRKLRDSWQPYDLEVYRSLDQERSAASKVRRQVAVGIQELLEKFGITP